MMDRLQLQHDFRNARERVLQHSNRRERILYGIMVVGAIVVTMLFWYSGS